MALWYFHEDHHQPKYEHPFERNDIFSLFCHPFNRIFIFVLRRVSIICFFIGLGIFAYGLSYFMIHDVLIHQRFKWFKNTNNKYLIGLRKAHKVHTTKHGKRG
jgi:beta-carotene 3-hydroxylase